jgi:hypothetical protein
MRTALGLTMAALVALLAAGCGPNCQVTCDRLYGSSGDNCSIARPNTSESDLKSTCMKACKEALKYPGELEGYDPDERQGSSASVEITNDKQAAVWMDCIAETSCEDLEKGYCAPVW